MINEVQRLADSTQARQLLGEVTAEYRELMEQHLGYRLQDSDPEMLLLALMRAEGERGLTLMRRVISDAAAEVPSAIAGTVSQEALEPISATVRQAALGSVRALRWAATLLTALLAALSGFFIWHQQGQQQLLGAYRSEIERLEAVSAQAQRLHELQRLEGLSGEGARELLVEAFRTVREHQRWPEDLRLPEERGIVDVRAVCEAIRRGELKGTVYSVQICPQLLHDTLVLDRDRRREVERAREEWSGVPTWKVHLPGHKAYDHPPEPRWSSEFYGRW